MGNRITQGRLYLEPISVCRYRHTTQGRLYLEPDFLGAKRLLLETGSSPEKTESRIRLPEMGPTSREVSFSNTILSNYNV